jgi:hypothetical protein
VSTPLEYADRVGASERTVRRWLADGIVPGAVKGPEGNWDIPAHAPRPVLIPRRDIVPRHDVAQVATVPAAPRVLPQGLWPLEDVATFYATTVGRVRVMGEHPRSPFVIGRFGPPDTHGHATWRVWVL